MMKDDQEVKRLQEEELKKVLGGRNRRSETKADVDQIINGGKNKDKKVVAFT